MASRAQQRLGATSGQPSPPESADRVPPRTPPVSLNGSPHVPADPSDVLRICIPVHNEATTIGVLLWRLRTVLQGFSREYDVVVYDDASTDGSSEVLEPYQSVMPLTVLRGTTHRGYAGSIDALVRHVAADDEYARRDAMVLLQGDFTESPEHLPELVKRFEGGADLVAVHRTISDATPINERRLRRWGRWAVKPFVRLPAIDDPFTGYRLVRISVLRDLLKALGNRPVCAGEGWAANIDFALNVTPFARRIENVEFAPRYDVRQRASRRRGWPDVVALFHWARAAKGTARPVPGSRSAAVDAPQSRSDVTAAPAAPVDRSARSAAPPPRSTRPERSARPERGPRQETEARPQREARPPRDDERSPESDKAARPPRPPRGERPARPERSDRPERPDRPEGEGEDRSERPARSGRPPRQAPADATAPAPGPTGETASDEFLLPASPAVDGALDVSAEPTAEGSPEKRTRRRRRRSRRDRGAADSDATTSDAGDRPDDDARDAGSRDDDADDDSDDDGENSSGADNVSNDGDGGGEATRRKRRPRRRRRGGRSPGASDSNGANSGGIESGESRTPTPPSGDATAL